jgi:hypothetical protein
VIIKAVADEFGEVLWLDTGAVMMHGRNISTVRSLIASGDGFYSAVSRGTTFQFVHVGTWAHLGLAKCCNAVDRGGPCCCCSGWSKACMQCGPTAEHRVTSKLAADESQEVWGEVKVLTEANMTWWRSVAMCNGAIIGFSRGGRAYNDLLVPWVNCAGTEDCIAPTFQGSVSNRGNHRQDQAALTMLAALSGFACTVRSIEAGFALHKDEVVDHEQCEKLLGRSVPKHHRSR